MKPFIVFSMLILVSFMTSCGYLSYANKESHVQTSPLYESHEEIVTDSDSSAAQEHDIAVIDISIDNWNEYFELTDVIEWDRNAFDEIDSIHIKKIIRLRSEYHGKIANESKIAFEVTGMLMDKQLIVDYAIPTYSIKEKTWEGGLGDGVGFTETVSLTLRADRGANEAYVYGCHDGYYMIEGEKVITIDILEMADVTRAQGTIHLYQ